MKNERAANQPTRNQPIKMRVLKGGRAHAINNDGVCWGGRIRTSDWLIQNQPSIPAPQHSEFSRKNTKSGSGRQAPSAPNQLSLRDRLDVVVVRLGLDFGHHRGLLHERTVQRLELLADRIEAQRVMAGRRE